MTYLSTQMLTLYFSDGLLTNWLLMWEMISYYEKRSYILKDSTGAETLLEIHKSSLSVFVILFSFG